ncbi:hypothetical protein EVAR_12741_1 [Eumeta japonica]|uniref:Uncharacterized protein n=1 Tax=Eumeta variegata TaxID=151549 RepID=A0A4C1UMQ3_EUMVA|nr:hypothetical protein EVAR_12741_1 [Eumeta japonica]
MHHQMPLEMSIGSIWSQVPQQFQQSQVPWQPIRCSGNYLLRLSSPNDDNVQELFGIDNLNSYGRRCPTVSHGWLARRVNAHSSVSMDVE